MHCRRAGQSLVSPLPVRRPGSQDIRPSHKDHRDCQPLPEVPVVRNPSLTPFPGLQAAYGETARCLNLSFVMMFFLSPHRSPGNVMSGACIDTTCSNGSCSAEPSDMIVAVNLCLAASLSILCKQHKVLVTMDDMKLYIMTRYPSVVTMADGRILIVGGGQQVRSVNAAHCKALDACLLVQGTSMMMMQLAAVSGSLHAASWSGGTCCNGMCACVCSCAPIAVTCALSCGQLFFRAQPIIGSCTQVYYARPGDCLCAYTGHHNDVTVAASKHIK